MYSSIITGAVRGLESPFAAVELDVPKDMPGFELVGQLKRAV